MTVSRATLSDLEAAASLFDRYRQFYRRPSNLEGARRFLRARLEGGESALFLAAVPDLESREAGAASAVGFTQLFPSFTSVGMRRVWVLNDLFVAEEARRRGVARALMEAARVFALEDGAARIELATERSNTRAQALYDALGYDRDDEFHHYSLTLSG